MGIRFTSSLAAIAVVGAAAAIRLATGCTGCKAMILNFQIYAPKHQTDLCRAVITGPNGSMAYDVAPYCAPQCPAPENEAPVSVVCPNEQEGGLELTCSRTLDSLYLGTLEDRDTQNFFDALGTENPSMTVSCAGEVQTVRGGAEDNCPR